MTGTEFRTLHGDPTTWTTTDIEAQQNLAEIDDLTHLLAGGATRAGKSKSAETLTALNPAV
ncbi:hypothetical protein OG298_45060 (plasmid) [Streptomyces sp. NBC_01005]|uniref:hypothetical protein n=1 Tax=unclassified Streptomyces TaxID=2593676 RepID=UPI002F9160CE|nr:hypothetical protein OG298_45060 [Streptomyces sp. NBC_01005]